MHALLINSLLNSEDTRCFSNEAEIISPEQESNFFSNFVCCGSVLPSLHDLVKHYEDAHIRIEDDTPQHSDFCSSDDDMIDDVFDASYEEHSQMNTNNMRRKHIALDVEPYDGSNEESSAFDNTILRRTSNSRLITSTALSARKVQIIRDFLGIYNENSLNQSFDEEEQNSRIFSILAASASSSTPASMREYDSVTFPEESLENNDMELEDKDKVKKPYVCTVPGCEKSYKNPNGLKYHMTHGHCMGSNSANSPSMTSATSSRFIDRPFVCTNPGCGKRYKNRNGLSYHVQICGVKQRKVSSNDY